MELALAVLGPKQHAELRCAKAHGLAGWPDAPAPVPRLPFVDFRFFQGLGLVSGLSSSGVFRVEYLGLRV